MKKLTVLPILVFVFAVFPGSGKAVLSSDGSPALAPDGTIYLVTTGSKRPFPTPGVYFSHGFKFADAVPASAEDLNLPAGNAISYADGTLVKTPDGTVYIASDSRKYGIVSAQVFRALGYSFANVIPDEGNLLNSFFEGRKFDRGDLPHPPGTLVNWSGAIYLVTSNGKVGIPSVEIFNSHRYDFKNAVSANAADKSLHIEGLLQLRQVVANEKQPVAPETPSVPAPVPSPGPVPANQNPSAPSITGVIGIFPVNVQTFTFSGSDPDGDNLTVLADFGDGSDIVTKIIASGASFSLQHNWVYIGDYTITATASDTKGGTAQTSRPIKVSNDPADFGGAVTVLSPNGGNSYTQGQPIAISWRRIWVPLQTTGKVDVSYKRGGVSVSIATNIADSSYTWIPIGLQGSSDYKIVVSSTGTGGTMLSDESDQPFTINAVLGAVKQAY